MRAERLSDNRGWASVGTGEGLAPRTPGDVVRDAAVWVLVGVGWLLICVPVAIGAALSRCGRALAALASPAPASRPRAPERPNNSRPETPR